MKLVMINQRLPGRSQILAGMANFRLPVEVVENLTAACQVLNGPSKVPAVILVRPDNDLMANAVDVIHGLYPEKLVVVLAESRLPEASPSATVVKTIEDLSATVSRLVDDEIVQEAVQFKSTPRGDERFQQLMERYQGLVASICIWVGVTRNELDDACQVVWLRCFLKLGLYKPEKSRRGFHTWLAKLARNAALDFKNQFGKPLGEQPLDPGDDGGDEIEVPSVNPPSPDPDDAARRSLEAIQGLVNRFSAYQLLAHWATQACGRPGKAARKLGQRPLQEVARLAARHLTLCFPKPYRASLRQVIEPVIHSVQTGKVEDMLSGNARKVLCVSVLDSHLCKCTFGELAGLKPWSDNFHKALSIKISNWGIRVRKFLESRGVGVE